MNIPSNLTEAHVLALTIWGEARGEGLNGMVAVGVVIANRVHDPQRRYGKGWKGVCLQKWQFSCWWFDDGNGRLVQDMARQPEGATTEIHTYAQAKAIADGLIAAGEAKHYMTSSLFEKAPPGWAKDRIPDQALGEHLFFEGVDG